MNITQNWYIYVNEKVRSRIAAYAHSDSHIGNG